MHVDDVYTVLTCYFPLSPKLFMGCVLINLDGNNDRSIDDYKFLMQGDKN
jgi:hypothetical protein